MREVAGLAALDLVLLGVGVAWTYGLGLARTWGDLLRLVGLAFLLGWAAMGVAVTLALVAGLAVTVWQSVLVAIGLAAGGLSLSKVTLQQPVAMLPWRSWERRVGWLFAAALVVFVGHVLRRAWLHGATEAWDAWSFWLPRAESLVHFDGIDLSPGVFTAFAHPYYPPLVPGMDSLAFRFMGETDASRLPLQECLLYAAFLGAVAGLLARRVSPAVLWPGLLALAAMPSLTDLVGSALADLPLALLFALAGVCAALWLSEGSTAHLGAAAILLAGVAVTKSDGFPLALLLVAVLTLAALATRQTQWWLAPALAIAPLASAVPWKVWVAAHDLPPPGDYRVRDLLDPSHLADQSDRLDPIWDALPGYLLEPDRWLLAVPLLVAAALLARRGTAVLALGVLVAGIAGLTLVYWGGSVEIDFWLESSAGRTVSSLTVFAAALVPLLLGEALRDRR